MIKRLFILILGLTLTGCGFGGEAVTDAERRVGAEQHPHLLAAFGGIYEGDEAVYLAALGEKIATAADLQGQCTFTLVNSDVVNAFAVPGCYIYVTRGLMGLVNSEAELASVLAHEVGHIAGNHNERQQRRSVLRGLGVAAINILTGSERLSRIAGEAAAYFTLRYSRAHEHEADDLALRYLREAGYDPYAAVDMLSVLARQEQFLTSSRTRDEARSIPEWALTHPLTDRRIARSLSAVKETGLGPNELPENEERYLRFVDGMLYGDDPEQGFVIGRRFAHPIMRIGFAAPQGFTLTNSPQAILIEGPDGLRGEFSGGALPPGGLAAYTEAVLAGLLRNAPVEVGPGQPALVNGVPALFVPALVQTQGGPVSVSVAAYAGGGGDAYHFVLVTKPTAEPAVAMESLFASFRLLSAEEAANLRPRRIRVTRVQAGETLQALARRMAADEPLARFLLLNGRTAEDPPKPGDAVKLVVLSPN